MLLRVRGQGASPENSQAALMHLRGFRLTNPRPPDGAYISPDSSLRPFIFPHFRVAVQPPAAADDTEVDRQLRRAMWREIWNMYDITYDALRLFPTASATAALFSGGADDSDKEFQQLSCRDAFRRIVVVTHYFPEPLPAASALPPREDLKQKEENIHNNNNINHNNNEECAAVLVLDVAAVPLEEAADRLAPEIAWAAAYASLKGAFSSARCIIVRLPYTIPSSHLYLPDGVHNATAPLWGAAVQEGVDFMAEHVALVARDFMPNECKVPVAVVGRDLAQLQQFLIYGMASDSAHAAGTTTDMNINPFYDAMKGAAGVVLFRGDHMDANSNNNNNNNNNSQETEAAALQSLASSLGTTVRLETVPLKALLEDGEESWDEATTRENQVLNFCPCCGHCGH